MSTRGFGAERGSLQVKALAFRIRTTSKCLLTFPTIFRPRIYGFKEDSRTIRCTKILPASLMVPSTLTFSIFDHLATYSLSFRRGSERKFESFVYYRSDVQASYLEWQRICDPRLKKKKLENRIYANITAF